MSLLERFNAWRLAGARRETRMVEALTNVGVELVSLVRAFQQLERAVVSRPEIVTAMVFGERKDEPGSLVVLDAQTRQIGSRESGVTIELGTNWPVSSYQVVTFASLERVQVVAIYAGPNVLAMDAPIAYGRELLLGVRVRVICQLREVTK